MIPSKRPHSSKKNNYSYLNTVTSFLVVRCPEICHHHYFLSEAYVESYLLYMLVSDEVHKVCM
jgi:hypothetical protein